MNSLSHRIISPSLITISPDADWPAFLFQVVWFAILIGILIAFLRTCMGQRSGNGQAPPRPGDDRSGRPPGYFGSPGPNDSPPPYDDHRGNAKPSPSAPSGWSPGFWGTLALGGIGNHLWNSFRNRNVNDGRPRRTYDWERERAREQREWRNSPSSRSNDDRGEGSSNLGSMRYASTFGGSTVR